MKKLPFALAVLASSIACLTQTFRTDVSVDVAESALAAYDGAYPAQLVVRLVHVDKHTGEETVEHHRLAVVCDADQAIEVRRDLTSIGCASASTAQAAIVPLALLDGEEQPACGAFDDESTFIDAEPLAEAGVDDDAFGDPAAAAFAPEACGGSVSLALE